MYSVPTNIFGVAQSVQALAELCVASGVSPRQGETDPAVQLRIFCTDVALEPVACRLSLCEGRLAGVPDVIHRGYGDADTARAELTGKIYDIAVTLSRGESYVALACVAPADHMIEVVWMPVAGSADGAPAAVRSVLLCSTETWTVSYRNHLSADTLSWARLRAVLEPMRGHIRQRITADFTGCIPPVTRLSPFAKIRVADPRDDGQSTSTADSSTGPRPQGEIRVWAQPSHLTSMPFLVTLLKLNSCCPVLYLDEFSPHFRGLLTSTTSQRLRYEAYRVLLDVFRNALCLVPGSCPQWALWFRRLTADVCRHVAMLNMPIVIESNGTLSVESSAVVALRLARRAVELYPEDSELTAVAARCAHLGGDRGAAVDLYRETLCRDGAHFEATHYIESYNSEGDLDISKGVMPKFMPLPGPSTGVHSFLKRSYGDGSSDLTGAKPTDGVSVAMLEKDVPLSSSLIWNFQRNYYRKLGLSAWSLGEAANTAGAKSTPFHATSNVHIASTYAQLVFSSIVDRLSTGQLDIDAPVYIIELGAGHGVLSRRFAERLQSCFDNCRRDPLIGRQACSDLNLGKVKVVLIVSDVTTDNVRSCLSDETLGMQDYSIRHPFSNVNTASKEVLESQERNVFVDGASFNAESDSCIHLMNAAVTIGGSCEQTCRNHVFVVSNYLFDSLATDAFQLTARGELHYGVSTLYRHYRDTETRVDLDEMTSLDLHNCEQVWNYSHSCLRTANEYKHYNDAEVNSPGQDSDEAVFLDEVLNTLVKHVAPFVRNVPVTGCGECIYFSFPCSAIKCLARIQRWSVRNEMVLLAADKAVNSIESLLELSYPPIVSLHGSLSITVNFIALSICMQLLTVKHSHYRDEWNNDPVSVVWNSPQKISDVDILFAAVLNTGDRNYIPKNIPRSMLPLTEWVFRNSISILNNHDLRLVRDNIEEAYFDSCRAREESQTRKEQQGRGRYSEQSSVVPPVSRNSSSIDEIVCDTLFEYSFCDPDIIAAHYVT